MTFKDIALIILSEYEIKTRSKGMVGMEKEVKYFIKDKKTGTVYNGIEETRKALENDNERLNEFNKAYDYYKKFGWFGGWNGDLHEIDLMVL